MTIPNLVWVLPRPPKSRYPGGFPLWFEKKLFELYPSVESILQPFGGRAENGLRCDIHSNVGADVVCDAHVLPFADNSFDFVLLDPPYSDEESAKLYGTPKLNVSQYSKEAVRVCKPGGFVALYHKLMLPRPPQTVQIQRIFVGTRIWHTARICGIYQKYECHHSRPPKDCKECYESWSLDPN